MAVCLRLMRFGKRKNPVYRIVVINKRKKRNTKYIEKIGFYNPMEDPAVIEIDKKRYDYWIKNGALISSGLLKLFKHNKSIFKKD